MPRLASLNPATGELVLDVEEHSDADVDRRLAGAAAASARWRAAPVDPRVAVLRSVADIL